MEVKTMVMPKQTMLEIPFLELEGTSALHLENVENDQKSARSERNICTCQKKVVPLQPNWEKKQNKVNRMVSKNVNLQAAKNLKDDEFYTTYESIVEELSHYTHHFKDKVILCNCDDPFESNFCKYFLQNFKTLGIKRLICTSYKSFDAGKRCGCVMDVHNVDESYMINGLQGDGDFRSEECIEYLKIADIVVTNPPFSLFKQMVSLLTKYQKKFLLVGNQNALTYKEIFPLIQNNEVWTGYRFGDMKFRVPKSSAPRKTRYWVDHTGQKWRSLGNAMWLTNLDIELRHQEIQLVKQYNEIEYPKYDDYDAINVRRVQDIPHDYPGIMGVPITIINKYNPNQFELIGEANHGSDNEYDLFKPTIDGKVLFKRILIRNKHPQTQSVIW